MMFVADSMLGRLARWLRLLGFDVLYDRHADDRELIRVARAEGRTLLTRDTALARRMGAGDAILITSEDVEQQVLQLRDRLDPAAASPHGRCDVCNGLIVDVPAREEARDLVPEHVYRSAAVFSRCASCGRIYWQGTHYRSFHKRLRVLMGARHED